MADIIPRCNPDAYRGANAARTPGGILTPGNSMEALTELVMDRPMMTVIAMTCGMAVLSLLLINGIEVD
jgi:hypothetical protein